MARPGRKPKAGRVQEQAPTTLNGRAEALALALAAKSIEDARSVTEAAVQGWWGASLKANGATADRFPLAQAPAKGVIAADLREKARTYGEELAALPPEDAAEALGLLYTRSLPADHRAEHGVFYTPGRLANRLLDKAEANGHCWLTKTAIDPSAGGGAFLTRMAQRTAKAMEGSDSAIILQGIQARLKGWELDPFAVWLANAAISVAVLEHIVAANRPLQPIVEVRDALQNPKEFEGRYHLTIANPPFGKVRQTPEMVEKFGRSMHGHPNLYGLFMDLGITITKPGGQIAYITPTSYLAGNYFKNLRKTLAELAPPLTIDLIESRKEVFPDVLQEVAMATFLRGGKRQPVSCSKVSVTAEGMEVQRLGATALPWIRAEPWILPRTPQDVPLIEAASKMRHRLKDYGYKVSTGPLVWNRNKTRLHDDTNKERVPIIWSEAVTQDQRFVLKADLRQHKPYYERRSDKDSNVVKTGCVLLHRTTAKEQHRRLIAAELPQTVIDRRGGVAVENHLNMVKPNPKAKVGQKVSVSVLAAFLQSAVADRVFRCICASVAVSASELEAIPLPPSEQLAAAMASSDPEAALCRLYGIADEPAASSPVGGNPEAP